MAAAVAAAVEVVLVEEASKEAPAEVWKGGWEGSKTVRERVSYIASKRIAVASSSADHSVTRRQVTTREEAILVSNVRFGNNIFETVLSALPQRLYSPPPPQPT